MAAGPVSGLIPNGHSHGSLGSSWRRMLDLLRKLYKLLQVSGPGSRKSIAEAETYCHTRGAILATMTTQVEMNSVSNIYQSEHAPTMNDVKLKHDHPCSRQ